MAYFVVNAERDGSEIVRLTVNGDFSVKWPEVLDQAYTTPTDRNRALIAFCRLFLGAKDRFWTKPWAETQDSDTPVMRIGVLQPGHGSIASQAVLVILSGFNIMARINYDLSWSMRWDAIAISLQEPEQSVFQMALCRLFQAAKDNFITTPW